MPAPALSDEAKAQPAAQLLAGALLQSQSSGKPGALIQVPPSPLSAGTLQALQQSSQQFAVRDQSIAAQAAEAPARELRRALASVTRETTVTTPATTTTTLVETPATTVTRTVTETVTVPGAESSGVQELRALLDRASDRAGAIEDRGNGRASDRRVERLAGSVERRGDQLLDALDRILDRGGSRTERRVERALAGLGESLVRSIDRLFDRGGERGVSALDDLVEQNSARIVDTFGKVLAATGEDVTRRLENLLVKAGPEVIEALQGAVDRVRPTTTVQQTREETEVIPGSVEAVTTTIPGSTVTTSNREVVEPPPTPVEARTEVRRQVEAYSTASNLVAPLQELASPPPPVPNPAAIVQRPEPRDGGARSNVERTEREPRARDDEERQDRRIRPDRSEDRVRTEEPRPAIAFERQEIRSPGLASLAPPIGAAETARAPGALVEIAA